MGSIAESPLLGEQESWIHLICFYIFLYASWGWLMCNEVMKWLCFVRSVPLNLGIHLSLAKKYNDKKFISLIKEYHITVMTIIVILKQTGVL